MAAMGAILRCPLGSPASSCSSRRFLLLAGAVSCAIILMVWRVEQRGIAYAVVPIATLAVMLFSVFCLVERFCGRCHRLPYFTWPVRRCCGTDRRRRLFYAIQSLVVSDRLWCRCRHRLFPASIASPHFDVPVQSTSPEAWRLLVSRRKHLRFSIAQTVMARAARMPLSFINLRPSLIKTARSTGTERLILQLEVGFGGTGLRWPVGGSRVVVAQKL
jgi:hypothetical protein